MWWMMCIALSTTHACLWFSASRDAIRNRSRVGIELVDPQEPVDLGVVAERQAVPVDDRVATQQQPEVLDVLELQVRESRQGPHPGQDGVASRHEGHLNLFRPASGGSLAQANRRGEQADGEQAGEDVADDSEHACFLLDGTNGDDEASIARPLRA
jgi:hypothetical protein